MKLLSCHFTCVSSAGKGHVIVYVETPEQDYEEVINSLLKSLPIATLETIQTQTVGQRHLVAFIKENGFSLVPETNEQILQRLIKKGQA